MLKFEHSGTESGTEPQPKSNLVHFSVKIWHMAATIAIFSTTIIGVMLQYGALPTSYPQYPDPDQI